MRIGAQIIIMQGLFPTNQTELTYHTPRQLLMAVMLSAQSTDKHVNSVTKTAFNTIKNPNDVTTLWLDNLKKMLQSINFFHTKSLHIYKTAQILIDPHTIWHQYDGYVMPTTLAWLTTLPWVGTKTAKVVLSELYGDRHIAVDTHIHRVANRLWRVSTQTALQTWKIIETVIPKKYHHIAHHSILLFGRYVCMARNPACDTCPLQKSCPYPHKKLT